jgi:hypothetical protein
MATRSVKGQFVTHKNIVGIEQKLTPLKVGCLEVFDENKCRNLFHPSSSREATIPLLHPSLSKRARWMLWWMAKFQCFVWLALYS